VSSGRGGSSGMIPSFTSNFSSSPLWCTESQLGTTRVRSQNPLEYMMSAPPTNSPLM
jgi:hypothetical protein